MAFFPVANLKGPMASGVTIAGTPNVGPFPGPTKNLSVPLPRYNPSLNGVTPSPAHMIPIMPLPGTGGGGGGGGPVGSPIDGG